MKYFVVATCVFLVIINFDVSHTYEDKKTEETDVSFASTLLEGLKSFSGQVSQMTVKSYEEIKNIFSKDRHFGDYTINQLNV